MKRRAVAGLVVVGAVAAGSGLMSAQFSPARASDQGSTPSLNAGAFSSPYGTNSRGETYGSALKAASPSQLPDLIFVRADNGKFGYLVRSDFEGPSRTLAQVRKLSTDISGNFVEPARVVPVFSKDGITKIGVFTILPGEITPGSK